MTLSMNEMQRDYYDMLVKMQKLIDDFYCFSKDSKQDNREIKYDKESTDYFVYDRVNIGKELSGTYGFFNIPVGGTAKLTRYETTYLTNKTRRDTNLNNYGSDINKDFLFHGISIAFVPNLIEAGNKDFLVHLNKDIFNIRTGSYLNFKIVDRNIMDYPLFFFPIFNKSMIDSFYLEHSEIENLINSGKLNQSYPYYPFKKSIDILAGQIFSVYISFDGPITLQNSFDMYVIFHGQMKRPS